MKKKIRRAENFILIGEGEIVSYEVKDGVKFSGKELAFLGRYVKGMGVEEIGKELGCSLAKMTAIKKEVRKKLQSPNDFEMVRMAFEKGLVELEGMNGRVKDIVFNKAVDIVKKKKEGKDLERFPVVFELLMSFYREVIFEECVRANKPVENL